jgi:hypothetical protein
MDNTKFLIAYFSKLNKKDFADDKFLKSFYNYFKKSLNTDLFSCYIGYITRNTEFENNNDRIEYIEDLYKRIVDDILNRTVKTPSLTDIVLKSPKVEEPAQDAPIKLSKSASLAVLSKYICDSSIITYEDPNQDISNTIEDEIFRNDTTHNIEKEILQDGRVMPKGKKDTELNNRNHLMNIWRETEDKCNVICHDAQMQQMLSKIYYIDVSLFNTKQSTITTIADNPTAVMEAEKNNKKYISLIPITTLNAVYSNKLYKTKIRIYNSDPVFESKIRLKSAYICAGSGMVQGGNADQGLSVTESMLYLTTSYSIASTKAVHSYPLLKNHVLVCPNVLVFKDLQYKTLPMPEYKRISVICAPSPWRPKLNNTNGDTPDLFDVKTKYMYKDKFNDARQYLANVFEVALYRGYDTIILDDRGICDNLLPCHETAIMVRDVINMYKDRFEEIIIAITNITIYNIYKQYIQL